MSVDIMLSLIPQCIPERARQSHTPLNESQDQTTIHWIQTLWQYLCMFCPHNIASLEGEPILPVRLTKDNSLHVVQLSRPTSLILTESREGSLTLGVQNVLHTLGVMLVTSLPLYVESHSQVVGTYVLPVTPEAAIKCALACNCMGSVMSIQGLSKKDRDEFRSFIAKSTNLTSTSEHTQLLHSLPIFPTIQQGDLVRLNDVNVMASSERPNISISQLYLNPRDGPTCDVVRVLGLCQYSIPDFLTQVVLPQLKQQNYQSQHDLDMVIMFIRVRWKMLHNTTFVQMLQDIPFVQADDGSYKRPQELSDPHSVFLKRLYSGESGKFPILEYTNGPPRIFLLNMGMKVYNSITAAGILECAKMIESMTSTYICDMKANAILEYLNRNPYILSRYVDKKCQLVDSLREINWVPVQKIPPKAYPEVLKWYDGPSFVKPCEVETAEWSLEVGAVMSICKYQINQAVASRFGWDKTPPLEKIIEQLKEVTSSYNTAYKTRFLDVLNAIYTQVSHFSSAEVQKLLSMQGLEKWMWCGDSFTTPKRIVRHDTFTGLQPYLYSLPPEMENHDKLLNEFGMAESCTPDVLIQVLYAVKNEHEQTEHNASVISRDLQKVINIVNHLAQDADCLNDQTIENLLLPLHADGESLKLEPLSKCTYCDREWLKHEGSYLGSVDDDDFNFIHENVPMKTAELLGVPTLMSRVLDAENLDIKAWGQHEDLTIRIKGLLENYKDGFAIAKEIIQNAADAGAKVVKFLYDERMNVEFRERLITPEMQECQGPALWAYNDALFTKSDFENIIKLGAATKENLSGKIGKFGLGFNAVYNITDVPSFLSGEQMVIFDPHCSHLAGAITNSNKPGIKFNLCQNTKLKQRCSNQFAPYDKVFGYDVQSAEPLHGTLFRLPLRTNKQARASEISSLHYDRQEMLKLLTVLVDGAPELLLFTESVQCVELYHLPAEQSDPSNAFHVMTLTKNVNHTNDNLLAQADQYIKSQIPTPPNMTCFAEISVHHTQHANTLLGRTEGTFVTRWNVSWGMGQRASLNMARSNNVIKTKNLTPLASAAVLLASNGPSYVLSKPKQEGRVYCYLPLPIISGLPVHINASFAVTEDRKSLCFKTGDDKENSKADWNDSLLSDAVVGVYLSLLDSTAHIVNDTSLFDMWPMCIDTMDSMKIVERAFYANVVDHPNTPVDVTNGNVITISNMVCLHPDLAENEHIGRLVIEVMEHNHNVTAFPRAIFDTFKATGFEDFILQKLFDEEKFYITVFFPILRELLPYTRNQLVLYAMRQKCTTLNAQIQNCACIPVKPNGKLVKPCSLLDPECDAACLYKSDDKVFPMNEFAGMEIRPLLVNLGMRRSINWNDMLAIAEQVQNIYQKQVENAQTENPDTSSTGASRCPFLVKYFRHLEKMLIDASDHTQKDIQAFQMKLMDVRFLLPMIKPTFYTAVWKGETLDITDMLTAKYAYPSISKFLVSATQFILDDTDIPLVVMVFLGLKDKPSVIGDVLVQLESIMVAGEEETDTHALRMLKRICFDIYNFMHNCVNQDVAGDVMSLIKNKLQDTAFILINGRFYQPKYVAFFCPTDCSPFLLELPISIAKRWKHFFSTLGVKDTFEIIDYIAILNHIHEESGGESLEAETLATVINILNNLAKDVKANNLTPTKLVNLYGTVFLPDQGSVLRDGATLCFRQYELAWFTDDTNDYSMCVHAEVSSATATSLGVMSQRQAHYQKYGTTFSFGQNEELTTRLNRIVSGYPFNHEILKELIQNADDSGSSEIHFILDHRNHPDKRVMDDSWRTIQGPALCVFNNTPFTQRDITNIQNLGHSSKNSDPMTTGQYGIGFNSMYHLTDTPMFLTAGPDIGDAGETLCVFDPHGFLINGKRGIGFNDLSDLRKKYTDFFKCFLEEYIGERTPQTVAKLQNSTIFRFPLRNQGGAECSKIAEKCIHPDMVKQILHMLEGEAKDILIFLHSIKEIKISEISKNGQLKSIYSCKADVSDSDKNQYDRFTDFTKITVSSLKMKKLHMENIQTMTISYSLDIQDDTASQKWLVCQQVGFTDASLLPLTVRDTLKNDHWALCPRGGVAYCLNEQTCASMVNNPIDKTEPSVKKHKVFCILPMPIDTALSVHINGHFALDYENRMQICTKKSGGEFGAKWNDIICQHIIAPCYVTLLAMTKNILFKQFQETKKGVQGSASEVLQSMSTYMLVFPDISVTTCEWNTLVKTVYHLIYKQQAPLLAVVTEAPSDVVDEGQPVQNTGLNQVHIQWLPTQKLYFCNSDKIKDELEHYKEQYAFTDTVSSIQTDIWALKHVLTESGLPLVGTHDTCDFFRKCFEDANVNINMLAPHIVVDFLKMYKSSDKVCDLKVQTLPSLLSHTIYRDVRTFQILLRYCALSDDFVNQLQGLPLLLTGNVEKTVNIFDKNNPLFMSTYYDLVPECSDQFVQQEVYKFHMVVNNQDRPESNNTTGGEGGNDSQTEAVWMFDALVQFGFFNEFDILAFADMLTKSTRNGIASQQPYQLNVRLDFTTNRDWLRKVWNFIYDNVVKALNITEPAEHKDIKLLNVFGDRSNEIEKCISPLKQWCILPVSISAPASERSFMYPIVQACDVMTFHKLSPETSVLFYGLPLPQPSLGLEQLISHAKVCHLIRCCVSDPLQKPHILLKALVSECRNILRDPARSNETRNTSILMFFQSRLAELKGFEPAAEYLRKLPLYKTLYHGDMVSLDENAVYVLPKEIPRHDMDVWHKKEDTIFLEEYEALNEYYKFIGCKALTDFELYTTFTLQHMEYLTGCGRLIHLKYLYDNYLKKHAKKNVDSRQAQTLIDIITHVAFVEDSDGDLHRANEYLDPVVTLYTTMRPKQVVSFDVIVNVGRHIFSEDEWLDLLRLVGLVTEATTDMLVEFAQEIARAGLSHPATQTASQKAMILMQYLFEKGSNESMKALRSIAFVPKLKIDFQNLHPSSDQNQLYTCLEGSYTKTYLTLVWTKANIIPDWAYPEIEGKDSQVYLKLLNMDEKPPVIIVLSHLSNLCDQLENYPNEAVDEHSCKLREKAFKDIFIYLQSEEENLNEELVERLKILPCVLVEGGQRLVCASQTVLHLKDEIRSHLYRLPAHFGDCHKLLKIIGTTDTVTLSHYVAVLHRMYDTHCRPQHTNAVHTSRKMRLQVSPLNPSQLYNAAKPIYSFFTLLLEDADSSGIVNQTLYLLSDSGKLILSSELVFNDRPSYHERISGLGLEFLAPFIECGIRGDPEDMIERMPDTLRPKRLSSIVTEAVDADCSDAAKSNALTEELDERIRSKAFYKATVRLISHERYMRGIKSDMDEMQTLESELTTVSVKMVQNMSTHLVYRDNEINGSKRPQTCFMQVEHLGSRTTVRTIYLEEINQMGMDVIVRVAEEISKVMEGRLQNSVLYQGLLFILQNPLEEEIEAELDRLNIRQDLNTTQTAGHHSLVPKPGAEITQAHQQLMTPIQQANDLHVDDGIVGYKPHQNAPSVYVVIKQLPDRANCAVDIGRTEYMVVPLKLLFTFE